MNICVLAVRSSLKWVGQDLKVAYVYKVNSILCWFYLSSWPLARTQLGEKRPVETWGSFPILANQHLPCHPNTHAIEPLRLGGLKVGQGGQAAIAAQSCKEQEEKRVPVGNSSWRIPVKNTSGRAKHNRDRPSLRGARECSLTFARGGPSGAENWNGEDGEGMKRSLKEVESLSMLGKNRHSIQIAFFFFFKRVLLDEIL